MYGRRPRVPTAARALQPRAKAHLTSRAYAYVAGGAGGEATQRANRAAFDRWVVAPRVLRDASVRDTSVELFGRRLPAALLLAPVGALELVLRQPVEERASAPVARDRQPRPTAAAVRALVGMACAWPGPPLDNLRSPLQRAAVETFLAMYSRPSITWADLAWLRGAPGCRSC